MGIGGLPSRYADVEHLMADRVPMIIPPTATKSAFYQNSTLRSLWGKAAEWLAGADELFVLGYSLPPSDVVVRTLLATTFSDSTVLPVDVADTSARFIEIFDEDRVVPTFCDISDPISLFVKTVCQLAQ